MEVADRIVVINRGRVEQVGTAAQIYDNPASPFVMNFVGEVNRFPGSEAELFVRPHHLELHAEPTEGSLPAVVHRITHLGKDLVAELVLDSGDRLNAHLSRDQQLANGLERGSRLHVHARSSHQF